ncbi:hypothetical protein BDK51DRAFT_52966 [Blyttiomyces helicus]|uniref:Uncharacterized protein n=1 Tax=Blyttiomyces helicus TaxID=388810 RepID=A0A4P9W8M3_9FUNG|nr:hypothetical protein BDK51DRAFT_52966 [Blyttiomyces helicus]|eukprot:RKO86516.1 hypothetical protein BDK51DRAFT_52966 [Blyttiomyces helicus]
MFSRSVKTTSGTTPERQIYTSSDPRSKVPQATITNGDWAVLRLGPPRTEPNIPFDRQGQPGQAAVLGKGCWMWARVEHEHDGIASQSLLQTSRISREALELARLDMLRNFDRHGKDPRSSRHRGFVQSRDEYMGGREAEEPFRAYLGPVKSNWATTSYGSYVTICTEYLPKYLASWIQLVLCDPNPLVLKFPKSHHRSIISGIVTDLAASLHPWNYGGPGIKNNRASELIYQPDIPQMDCLKEVYKSANDLFMIPSPPPTPPPPPRHETIAQLKQRLRHGPDP